MRLYNRNGILYIAIDGKRLSSKLKDTPSNRKLLENRYRHDEFFQKFSVKTAGKKVLEFCEEILDEKELRLQPTTMVTYRSLYSSRIVPFFKKLYPHEVTPAMLKSYYARFDDKSTLNTCVSAILKPAFENALIEGYIKNTPFVISLPTMKSDYEINPFTMKEVDLILSNATGILKNILGVAFFTGARTGEVIALEWDDIDFVEKTISINKTQTRYIVKEPKTKSSTRVIDMLPQAEIFLRDQRLKTGLFKNVFLRKNNKIIGASVYLKNHWYKLLADLNLDKRSIYQTRHTFASNMLSNRENPLWVSQMIGHKSLNITLSIYTKYIKEERVKRSTFLDDYSFDFAQNKHTS